MVLWSVVDGIMVGGTMVLWLVVDGIMVGGRWYLEGGERHMVNDGKQTINYD